jgi:hypothetical protein
VVCCMERFGILHGITRENCGHLRMVVQYLFDIEAGVWFWTQTEALCRLFEIKVFFFFFFFLGGGGG